MLSSLRGLHILGSQVRLSCISLTSIFFSMKQYKVKGKCYLSMEIGGLTFDLLPGVVLRIEV